VRPYRYPQLLKDELERQCDEMLQQSIIRECTSAFMSPVLLSRSRMVRGAFALTTVNSTRRQ
jgi:hypothetical protein